MEIKFRDTNVERIKSDLLVVPVREKKMDDPALRALDRRLKGHLRGRIEKSKFTGAEGWRCLPRWECSPRHKFY
jgi:hypothetical protein